MAIKVFILSFPSFHSNSFPTLDSFPVQHYFSTSKKYTLRVLAVTALCGIFVFNFLTTCTTHFTTTFDGGCNSATLPSGSQLSYQYFSMSVNNQIEYDGFDITGCTLKDVVIQEWFISTRAPTFRMRMEMHCDQSVNLTVNDINFKFWHIHYQNLTNDAYGYRNIPGGPFEAIEFKWGFDPVDDPTSDNDIRFFTKEGFIVLSGKDPTLKLKFFYDLMQFALGEVQNKKIPGVSYLCNLCASKADWSTQTFSLSWKLFYNTLNTSASIYAAIIFALVLMEKSLFKEIYEDYVNRKSNDREEQMRMLV